MIESGTLSYDYTQSHEPSWPGHFTLETSPPLAALLKDIWVIKLLPISNIPGMDSFGVVVTGSISKRCWPGPWYRIMVATNRCDPSSIPNGYELKRIFRGESVGMVLV